MMIENSFRFSFPFPFLFVLFLTFVPVGEIATVSSALAAESPTSAADPAVKELSGKFFLTKDGVLMTGSYYPGKAGKESVPVVLLHGQHKDRTEFDPLVAELKKRGYAIIVPDLRGHGQSIKKMVPPKQGRGQPGFPVALAAVFPPGPGQKKQQPNRMLPGAIPPGGMYPGPEMMPGQRPADRAPKVAEYLAENFERTDYMNMMRYDYVPFRNLLLYENNREKLNINKLVLIGIDMGGTLGAFWAKEEWAVTKTKWVKSLIIVSPNHDTIVQRIFKENSKVFPENVSLLFLAGRLNAERLQNTEKLKADILGEEKESEQEKAKGFHSRVPVVLYDTERQGGELLAAEKGKVPQTIADFIELKLAKLKEKDIKWEKQ